MWRLLCSLERDLFDGVLLTPSVLYPKLVGYLGSAALRTDSAPGRTSRHGFISTIFKHNCPLNVICSAFVKLSREDKQSQDKR